MRRTGTGVKGLGNVNNDSSEMCIVYICHSVPHALLKELVHLSESLKSKRATNILTIIIYWR